VKLLVALIFLLYLLITLPLDSFLDSRMVGKAFVQTFSLIGLGILLGHSTSLFTLKDNPERISGLILFSFLFIFWSIPRSVDVSELYEWADQIYHLSMFAGGFILQRSLPSLPKLVKGVFGLLFSSMLTATAMVYRWKSVILCSTYTLYDQHLYGKVLLIFGLGLYGLVVIWIIFGWSRRGNRPVGRSDQNIQVIAMLYISLFAPSLTSFLT